MNVDNFHKSLNHVLVHFPDPFEESHIFKHKPDSKTLFVIEKRNVRIKMDKALFQLQKLLKTQLNDTQLKAIKKHWRELSILKSYYIKRFDEHQTILSTHNDMNAFFLLKQIIMEYEFFLKIINSFISHGSK
jgi:hypothetical protein